MFGANGEYPHFKLSIRHLSVIRRNINGELTKAGVCTSNNVDNNKARPKGGDKCSSPSSHNDRILGPAPP